MFLKEFEGFTDLIDQHQWLYDANVLLDVRRTADASRLSEGFRAKEPSVDPTRQVNMSVFLRGSLNCELAR